MKVAELQGPALDYWTAKADGWLVRECLDMPEMSASFWEENLLSDMFSPSTRWGDAGPIIEREHISVEDIFLKEWSAWLAHGNPSNWSMHGPTPLLAAMRCYVSSKYGDEVPDA